MKLHNYKYKTILCNLLQYGCARARTQITYLYIKTKKKSKLEMQLKCDEM